jgi:hypothetical protein
MSCTEARYGKIQSQEVQRGEVEEQYQVVIRNKFAALESLDDSEDINRSGDNIRENFKTSAQENLGYCELNHHKTWFCEECSKLVDQRKQAELQWLQHPSESE